MAEKNEELDEVKSDLEKLKADYQAKMQLNESLMRENSDQIAKIHEAQTLIERQAKELNAKSVEIAEVRQLYEDVTAKLHETESSLKKVNHVCDKLRIDTGEKMQNLEGENRKLAIALEEAVGKNEDLERKLCARDEEVEGLKALLSDSQRKCLEAEEKARAARELRQREDVISRLEEQSMSIQDQLKWKKEQFAHLEDAHKRLQDQFQLSKKEWVSEKSMLLDEIATLQSKLDSQIRISESLESRLKMCNQALAHEESRRKMLEVQLSESKQCFENVLAEYEEAKARLESLSTKRNEEIASLRNSIGMKETLMKEMEYKVAYLEQDNKELLATVKELQEAQINKRKMDPSLAKLRNRLKDLEQVHSNCSLTLKEKEAEWNSKLTQVIADMKCYESDLKRQSEELNQLKKNLDDSHSEMEICGEEISILLTVMKSELGDAHSKLFNSEIPTVAVSAEKLEMKNGSMLKAPDCLEQARQEIALLTEKRDSLNIFEEHCNILEKELEEHRNMLENSSNCQVRLKEQITQMESALKNMSDTLEKSNSELAVKITEANQAEMELQIWKSKAESLRSCLEQSEQMCKQMEKSFLEQVEKENGLRKENESLQRKSKEQEEKIGELFEKIVTLDQKLAQAEADNKVMKSEMSLAKKKEMDYVQTIEARDTTIDNLQNAIQKIELLSARECEAAKSAMREAEIRFECETEELCNITREKDERINCLQGLASSLEQKFTDMVLLSFSRDLEYLVKMNTLEDALKKTQSRMNSEIEMKNNAIDALQKETRVLQGKALLQEQSLSYSKQQAKELKGILEEKKLEIEKLVDQFQNEHIMMEERVKNLEREREIARENIERLSSERDELGGILEEKKLEMENLVDQFKIERIMLEERVENLEREREVARENIEKLSSERDELEGILEEKKLEIDNLVDQFKNECVMLEERVKNLEREREVARENTERLSSERGELEGMLEEKKLKIDNLVDQFKNERVMLEERVKNLEREREVARENIERLSSERDELKGILEEKKLDIDNLIDQFKNERIMLEERVKNLERESQVATENIERLSSERDNMLVYSEEICKHIGEVCTEDLKLEIMLGNLLQKSQDGAGNISDQVCDAAQKDLGSCFTNEVEARLERAPLREIN